MSLVGKLIGFGLRQVIGYVAGSKAGQLAGNAADSVDRLVEKHFHDNSTTLPSALIRANDRAWQALSIALAGDGLLDRIKGVFASGDGKGIREQVRLFLQDKTIGYEGTPVDFRQKCLDELNQARKAGLLTYQNLSPPEVARQTANFQQYANRNGMVQGAERVMGQIADDLGDKFPNLGKLMRQPTPGAGVPLLVAAFAFFFRREVETNTQLAHGLSLDLLRQLSASQDKAFEALNSLGDQLDQVVEQLDRIEDVGMATHVEVVETHEMVGRIEDVGMATHVEVMETHETVDRIEDVGMATHVVAVEMQGDLLDVKQELQNCRKDMREQHEQVLALLKGGGIPKGEVKPEHSYSIRSSEVREAVTKLFAQFRRLPADQQKQFPALLNGLGKLLHGIGDFEGARQSFVEVAENVSDKVAKAEAYYNAYRVALDKRLWDEALQSIQRAASLAPERFAPFPFRRYEPKRILGAGGFGAAFLCHDRNFDKKVVVKAFHVSEMERNLDSVFQEARILSELGHEAIIRVRDCEYADTANQSRPYLIMEFFPGGSLEAFVRERGTLRPEQLVVVARDIAAGMRAAHQQNILHRDLKPENVLVYEEGGSWKVKLIDFGLALRRHVIEASTAKAAAGDTSFNKSAVGTLKYAPPEQLDPTSRVPVGRYSDVYAFGKMCCFALFKMLEPKDRAWQTVPEHLRMVLKTMVDNCTEEEVEHRYPDFEPVLKMLEGLCKTPETVAPSQRPSVPVAIPSHPSSAQESDLTEAVRLIPNDESCKPRLKIAEQKAVNQCPVCGGQGTCPCSGCSGMGQVITKEQHGVRRRIACSTCQGHGSLTCGTCGGEGVVPRQKQENEQGVPVVIVSLGGVLVGLFLRVLLSLPAWAFGWDIGGWLTWGTWGAVAGNLVIAPALAQCSNRAVRLYWLSLTTIALLVILLINLGGWTSWYGVPEWQPARWLTFRQQQPPPDAMPQDGQENPGTR